MATALPIPPSGLPVINPITGAMDSQWQNYFLTLTIAISSIGAAPVDARYWVSNANGQLTNETNMGALASGYLKQVTAAGIATPSTVTSIPGTDVAGAALTRVNDTNVTATLGGTPTTALLAAVSLTLGWAGKLGLARGGSNADLSATGGAHNFLRQNSSGAAIDVIQPATTDLSDVGTNTAWTPTDASGAGLSFTVATGRYINYGSLVFTEFDLTYPVTGSGAAASIGGLPYTSIAVQQALSIAFTNLNIAAQVAVNTSASTISFLNLAGGAVTNLQFSGVTIRASGIWMHI